MKTQLIAAGFALMALGAVAPAMADGPRASGGSNWPGMTSSALPDAQATAPVPAAAGPRASGGTTWAGMTNAPSAQLAAAPTPVEQPHYEYIQGYGKGGRWNGQWEVVR